MFCPSCGKEIPDHSAFCLVCGKSIQVVAVPSERQSEPVKEVPVSPKKEWGALTWISVTFLVLLCGWFVVMFINYRLNSTQSLASAVVAERARMAREGNATQPVFIPRVEKLTSGQFIVKAGQIYYIRFNIDIDKMKDVRVVGRFQAAGGNNDIEAVIADEDNFENWKNGHEARVRYTSNGKTTVGIINTPISVSGVYFLGFSNRFSAFRDKYVDRKSVV